MDAERGDQRDRRTSGRLGHGTRRSRRREVAAGAAAFALILLYAAAPRFVASLIMLPSAPVGTALDEGRDVMPEDRVRHLGAIKASVALADDPVLLLHAARHLSDSGTYASPAAPDRRMASLSEARESAVRGLALAPKDARGWYTLARIAYLQNEPRDSVRALGQSWRVERHTWHLYFARIELALRLWPYVPLAERAAAFADIRAAWYVAPKTLSEMASDRVREGIILAAFAQDPLSMVEVQKFIWAMYPERRPGA